MLNEYYEFLNKSSVPILHTMHVRIVFPVSVMNIDTSRNRCKNPEARIFI